jgi:hypothetical protein
MSVQASLGLKARPYLKNYQSKKAGGVAQKAYQMQIPEFKPLH